jgi:hypothetical protein
MHVYLIKMSFFLQWLCIYLCWKIRIDETTYAICENDLHVKTIWKHDKWNQAITNNMIVLCVDHFVSCFDVVVSWFEALIIKQNAQIYS